MPDKINLPLLGPTSKGSVFAGGLAAVAVGGYLVYKHYTKQATMTGQPSTAYGYGYGYGAYAYGTPPAPAYGYGGLSSFGYGVYPYGYGYGSSGGGGNTPPTNNAAWAQAAESQLTSSGYGALAVAAALGKYLTGQPLSAEQDGIVRAAIAFEGYPPDQGKNGFPPGIRNATGGGGSGQHGGGGTGGTATNPVTGLHITRRGQTSVDIAWRHSKGAKNYVVTGASVSRTGPTSARIRNLRRDRPVTISVLAEPAATDAKPATIQVSSK